MTEQQVLALIAGEQRRLAHALMMEDSNAQGPMWGMSVMLKHVFPVPTAPPPAAESEPPHDPRFVGGQMWKHEYGPTVMLSLAGNGKMMLITDPRNGGSMASFILTGSEWTYTQAELREHLKDWKHLGSLKSLLETEWGHAVECGRRQERDAIAAVKGGGGE